MEQRQKGNVIVIIIIIAIIIITAGIIGWMFVKKTQVMPLQTNQSQPVAPQSDSAVNKNTKGEVVYKLGNNIVSYDLGSQQEKIILSSDKLIDFNISKDGKYLAYSLKEDGFEGNADIYFFDIANQKTVRLTEKNNIASLNPKIYSNGKRIAYLRRTFDTKNGKLRDGEIWTIDSTGDQNTSAKLYGDEGESWFDLNPKDRCCSICEGEDKPYEPKNMLDLKGISEDGNIISYRQGSFGLMCFAGFQMNDGTYDIRRKADLNGTEILSSKDNQYYAEIFSSFPSDPHPFCIKNTFFDRNGRIVWAPEKGIADSCQHDYYYKPLDFGINGNKVDMVYLKKSNDAIVLSENTFDINSNIKNYFAQDNLDDILYKPRVYYTEDGKYVNYTDDILSAKKIGNYVVFLEKKFKSEHPDIYIMDASTKIIQKTINLDNDQEFNVALSN